jgi:CheY-like chemotaxis protein
MSPVRDTVLVVDDDQDLRELFVYFAQSAGLRTLEAFDCRGAIEILERDRERVAMILLDYLMPGMAPQPCVQAIRALVDPSVPIVLVTASVNASERAQEVGLQQFLSKPFEIDEVKRIIAQVAPTAPPPPP